MSNINLGRFHSRMSNRQAPVAQECYHRSTAGELQNTRTVIPLNIHFKVSNHPTCYVARLHPNAAEMFSKNMLGPLSGIVPKQSQSYSTSHGKCCHKYTQLNWGLLGSREEILPAQEPENCLAYRKENLYEALMKDNEAARQVLWWQEATKRV